ncbi:MAG: acyltransferase [Granulosicoccus sp.]|nr:acyltransferase [Granulosicoccus sp.]
MSIGSGCTIGINTIVHATQDSDVVLGDNVLLAAQAYLIGGGSYGIDDLDRPFKEQGQVSLGGIHIESNVWIGSSAQILDGVKVGTGAIVGSGAVVNRHVERYHIVAGVPIKTIRSRKPDDLVAGQAS